MNIFQMTYVTSYDFRHNLKNFPILFWRLVVPFLCSVVFVHIRVEDWLILIYRR